MPPKGGNKRKAPGTFAVSSEASSAPQTPTLAESLSYLAYPRPFKNPSYTKNANRRTKNLKTVLTQERERERVEREKHRQARDDRMDIDSGDVKTEEDQDEQTQAPVEEELPSYASIEAPPSFLPQKRYCDITGLEAPYTDPATSLRYHDKSVYEFLKTLVSYSLPIVNIQAESQIKNNSAVKDYLALRGVNPIVK